MVKSKTKIEKQTKKKTNSELVETILLAKKNEAWLGIASILSAPARKRISLNLDEISKKSKDGETVVIPGKVLSMGDMDKKLKIVALNFSESAKEKLKNNKCELIILKDEIKSNPKATGIKIINN